MLPSCTTRTKSLKNISDFPITATNTLNKVIYSRQLLLVYAISKIKKKVVCVNMYRNNQSLKNSLTERLIKTAFNAIFTQIKYGLSTGRKKL